MKTRVLPLFIAVALVAMALAPIVPVSGQATVPIVDNVSPMVGTANGGTPVTLTGTGFLAGATVEMVAGGTVTLATGISVAGTGTLSFKTPPHPPGVVTLRVTNPGGAASTFSNAFTYEAPAEAIALTGVTPGTASGHGGATLNITGSGIHPDPFPRVTIGGTDAIVTGASSTHVRVIAPPGPPTGLAAVVEVTNPSQGLGGISNQAASLGSHFIYLAATVDLNINGVTPMQGSQNGGTSLTVTGTGFAPGVRAEFFASGTCAAPPMSPVPAKRVTFSTAGLITLETPSIAATGFLPLRLTNPDGESVCINGGFNFLDANDLPHGPMAATKVEPNRGPTLGGTKIDIIGSRFHPDATVTIGGEPADSVTFVSSTRLEAVVPAHSDNDGGPVDVEVANPQGTPVTLTGAFTYVRSTFISYVCTGSPSCTDPATSATSHPAGGEEVSLFGGGFLQDPTPRVFFGNIESPDVAWLDEDFLTAIAPPQAAGPVTLRVINHDGTGARIGNAFSYTASDPPTVGGISGLGPPAGGPPALPELTRNGGNIVTIAGTGFANVDGFKPRVHFGNVEVPADHVSVDSSIEITVKAPPRSSTGTVNVRVTNPDGQQSPSGTCTGTSPHPSCVRYLDTVAPEVTGLSSAGGPQGGGELILITGTGIFKDPAPTFNDGPERKPEVRFGTVVVDPEDVEVLDAGEVPCPAAPATPCIHVKVPPRTGTVTGSGVKADVRVTNPDGRASATGGTADDYMYSPNPGPSFTEALTVGSRPATGGFLVTVIGEDFFVDPNPAFGEHRKPLVQVIPPGTGGTPVTVPADFVTVVSDEELTFEAPGGTPAGTHSIRITNPDGRTVLASGVLAYTAVGPPGITGLDVETAPTIGGTNITIIGDGFADLSSVGPRVTIGGVQVPSDDFEVLDDTVINVTLPARPPGFANVIVTNPDGQVAVLGNTLRYLGEIGQINSLSVGGSSENGGVATNLQGANLPTDRPSVVFMDSLSQIFLSQAPTSSSGTAAGARVPPWLITPPATIDSLNPMVVDRDGQSAARFNGFTYAKATVPTFTSISDRHGSVNGGQLVTVTGQNFVSGAMVCLLDPDESSTRTASGVTISQGGTSLSFISPPGALGPKIVDIYNPLVAYWADDCDDLLGFPPDPTDPVLRHALRIPVPQGFGYSSVIGPTIFTVSPTAGPTTGGTTITITGANFASNAQVHVGGTPATSVQVASSTQLTAVTPAGQVGAADVRVTNPDGLSATRAGAFSYSGDPGPTLHATTPITPTSGFTTGGTEVTITGTNFVAGATVRFGTADATDAEVVSPTQITAVSPPGSVGAVPVTVRNPDGQEATAPSAFTYIQAPPPTLTSITPSSGLSTGGFTATLAGTNFASGATVQFGDRPATAVSVASASSLTLTVPGHPAGTVDVTFTGPDGQSVTLPQAFTYTAAAPPTVTSFSPTAGSAAGGTQVTILGTGFVAPVRVTFGGTAGTAVSVAEGGTSLTVTTPARAAGDVAVVVTNPDDQFATAVGQFTFRAVAPIDPVTIGAANQAVLDSLQVRQRAGGNLVSWDPDAVPGAAAGVSIWRIDSPAVWIVDVLRGSEDFERGQFLDADGSSTSKYLVTVFFGTSLAEGYSTSSIHALPGYQDLSEDDVAAFAVGVSTDRAWYQLWWVWLLVIIAVLGLAGLSVLGILAMSRRGEGKETAGGEWDSDEDVGWADEGGLDLDVEGEGEGGLDIAGEDTGLSIDLGEEEAMAEQAPAAAAGAFAGEGEAAVPDEGAAHNLECPNCQTQFTAHGDKPIITACPGCGKRGILR